MTGESIEELRDAALDRTGSRTTRLTALRELATKRNRRAAEAIIEICELENDDRAISHEGGALLASYLPDGLVTDWDVRNISVAAAEGFFR